MLKQLLSLLATGGVHTPSELAARLGVTESLLEQMLADLSRMGYLRSDSGSTCPAAHCTECPLEDACAVGEPGGKVWTLTDKALR